MNIVQKKVLLHIVSAGCHINDVMNDFFVEKFHNVVSAGCHINDVMNTGEFRDV